MKLWLFFYLLVPVLVGMLINEYKNDIFRLLKMSSDYNVTRGNFLHDFLTVEMTILRPR